MQLAGGRMLAVSLPMCLACGGAFVAWGLLVAAGTGGKAVHAAAMVAVGFLVAGPDGILGGAASKNLCEYNLCEAPEMAPAVSGLVNGIASLGVIAMSAFTANLVSVFGWSGLFLFLGAMLGASVLLAIPSVMVEGRYFTSTVARAGKK
jgi:sugar phosphate permease